MTSYTMQEVLHRLMEEMPAKKAFEIYEWYCTVYGVSASDEAPASVRYEVFGK